MDAPEDPEIRAPARDTPANSRGAARRALGSILPCLRIALVSGTTALIITAFGLTLTTAAILLAFRYLDPPGSMVMAARQLRAEPVEQHWIPISAISPHLVRAVIMSEDNQFCRHFGIDITELLAAIEKAEDQGDDFVRGASTISMQTVKNLLLWSDRSYARKAIEVPVTLMMEQLWPKRRIMEIYLNIAEFGPGIYGAEAAARYHFRKPARRLNPKEATLLAVRSPTPPQGSQASRARG